MLEHYQKQVLQVCIDGMAVEPYCTLHSRGAVLSDLTTSLLSRARALACDMFATFEGKAVQVCICCVSLQALCVNDAVLKLGSLSRINERCLELKKGKPKRQAAAAATQKPKVRHQNVVHVLMLTESWTLHGTLHACQTFISSLKYRIRQHHA